MSQPTYYYVWTLTMQDRLLALLKQGMPYKEIAATISSETGVKVTKNSCIGKGRRMGVPLRLPARKPLCLKRSEPKSPAKRKPHPSARRSRPRKRKLRAHSLRSRKLRPQQSLRNLSLIQLRTSSCRYPTGHNPPYSYCGARQQDGSSYCPEHHALCHYKGRALL